MSSSTLDEKREFALECFAKYLGLDEDQKQKMAEVLPHIDHFEILKPLIVMDLLSGIYSCEGIAVSYQVSYDRVRWLGQKMGIYKSRPTLIKGVKTVKRN